MDGGMCKGLQDGMSSFEFGFISRIDTGIRVAQEFSWNKHRFHTIHWCVISSRPSFLFSWIFSLSASMSADLHPSVLLSSAVELALT